ncbi:MAG: AraC family transcriptional regulator, partial [Gammaproteobacteria bacterium]|nr:AraC family transcriptional regulator [Gammaproteobacteria bacterium]
AWADRGRQLQISAGTPAPEDICLGLSRLGGAAVPASLPSVFIQLRGSAWVESREGRFELRQGDWIMFERDSAPVVQAGS